MKAMDFLTLLGDLDEGAVADTVPVMKKKARKQKKRRALWVAAAACFCACLLGFSAWFFLPPNVISNQALLFTVVRVEDQLLSYEIIQTKTMSRFELLLLPDEPGEVMMTHGDSTFYRVAEAEDLVYIIQIDGGGKQTVLEFHDYVNTAGVDMTTSYWYESGWLDDEDIAALQGGGDGTMGEILKIVYGVDSAEDIRSICFGKYGDEDSVSRRVRIKKVRITDRETVARIYGMLASMTSMAYGQEWHSGSASARDEAYLNGEKPLSAQVDREITVTLASGRELTFYYYPVTGFMRRNRPEFYTVLSEADNEWLIALAEIDMEWKDWGTEKDYEYGGEGCETATTPIIPDPQAP